MINFDTVLEPFYNYRTENTNRIKWETAKPEPKMKIVPILPKSHWINQYEQEVCRIDREIMKLSGISEPMPNLWQEVELGLPIPKDIQELLTEIEMRRNKERVETKSKEPINIYKRKLIIREK